ncbi:MAG: transglycosylase domain-containing protein, partial [Actinobacteria bacterium]|nr:transglycosylase domain-containing protein [Actinomycetota bacterium]
MPLSKPTLSTFYSEGKPTTAGWIAAGIGAVGLVAVIAVAVLTISALRVDVPLPDNAPGGQATEVLDAHGDLIGALKGEQKRQIVELADMAPALQEAVVATEDRRFYEHNGLSFRGMVRALLTNTWAGEVEQGGSTITQQYARNAFGRIGTERTVSRKVKEIVVARKVENRYSKDKILESYLNTVYFGRGAYGAEAAALTYFKKPAKDLTLDEAAFLAGIIRSPEYFQPEEHAQDAVRIRNKVLGDMVAAGYLTEAEADEARRADLIAKFKLGPTHLDSPRAGFFMEHVRRLLRSDQHGFSDAELLGGGLTIHTSLDLHMQDAAEAAVFEVLPEPDNPEVALIAMDPDGFVRAMVGGRDVKDRVRALGFNFASNVRQEQEGGRPAGSAFKPIALARYLEQGGDLSDRFRGPRQITIDSPLCRGPDGEPWTVSNYGNQGYGTWATDSANAIKRLRANGISHTIMVDAPNWGQDWSFTMRDNAASVFDADPRVGAVALAQGDEQGRAWPPQAQPAPVSVRSRVASFVGYGHVLRRRAMLQVGGYREE